MSAETQGDVLNDSLTTPQSRARLKRVPLQVDPI